jgi:glutaryl-CoA dehydrogenase
VELAGVDGSVATYCGVHSGLSAGSIYFGGDEAQKQAGRPPYWVSRKSARSA